MKAQARRWLAAALLAMLAAFGTAHAQSPAVLTIDHAEATPADWASATPPDAGWTPVTLMDFWDARWPKHDGVVWYRLHWQQAGNNAPAGLLLDYACLAQAVYLNGSLIYRDKSLVEPLSRSWIRPHYFLIDQPLLRAGDNTLLVRVSGLAAYQPGFGKVTVGPPDVVEALYRHDNARRYGLHLFSQAVDVVFCGLFFLLWLLRRKDTTYGWYALGALCSLVYSANFLATDTWPFASTDAWEALNLVAYVANAWISAVFLLRFCEHRWPRAEAITMALVVAQTLWACLLPHAAAVNRQWGYLGGSALNLAATIGFIGYALRGQRRMDQRVLALCLMIPCVIGVRDLLIMFGVLHESDYLLAVTAPLSLIGVGFALAYRFATAMRRVESFNTELAREVDAATSQLAATLQREHTLAIDNTRIGERLNLVRDLHDGFGGSLVGAIATLEQSPDAESTRAINLLKELRDDLRLVIDTTTHDQGLDLCGLLAPLRHRWNQRLEIAGIDSRWQIGGLDGLRLGSARSLDLLRFLQEALTNVLKHSAASRADIAVLHLDGRLRVTVNDDGRGFDPASRPSSGAGLTSLHARARRLGGQLALHASPGHGTRLLLDIQP